MNEICHAQAVVVHEGLAILPHPIVRAPHLIVVVATTEIETAVLEGNQPLQIENYQQDPQLHSAARTPHLQAEADHRATDIIPDHVHLLLLAPGLVVCKWRKGIGENGGRLRRLPAHCLLLRSCLLDLGACIHSQSQMKRNSVLTEQNYSHQVILKGTFILNCYLIFWRYTYGLLANYYHNLLSPEGRSFLHEIGYMLQY